MKVYLDMDRVIADFDKGVRKYALIEPPDQKNKEQVTEMWKKLSKVPHYYDKLDLMPDAEHGVAVLFGLFGNDLEILTGVPNPTRGLSTASADKKTWMKRKFPQKITVNTVLRAEKKSFCTGKDCILIDDNEQNISEWEASGGTGILFKDWEQTLKIVLDMLHYN